jgi:hypothetical protein
MDRIDVQLNTSQDLDRRQFTDRSLFHHFSYKNIEFICKCIQLFNRLA